MFFSTVANLLSSIPTFLFPVFASYKALKTSDPALLKPWLMYWVVLAVALFAESWLGFILFWIPFYAWFRLGFLLYLILPQSQGARVLYQTHVDPFLQDNENAIDDFISSAHDRAKAAGLEYLKSLVELIKQYLLGLPPKEPTPPPTPSALSYTQSLIARFNIPSARPAYPSSTVGSATSTANDFYSLLASAVSAATSGNASNTQVRDLSNSGTLIPPSVDGAARLSFIASQRERLTILLSALDKEANTLKADPSAPGVTARVPSMFLDGSSGSDEDHLERSASGLSTRKSEPDFEKIDAEGVSGTEEPIDGKRAQARRSQSSGSTVNAWMPWSWGAKPEESMSSVDTVMGNTAAEKDIGKSSGLEY